MIEPFVVVGCHTFPDTRLQELLSALKSRVATANFPLLGPLHDLSPIKGLVWPPPASILGLDLAMKTTHTSALLNQSKQGRFGL